MLIRLPIALNRRGQTLVIAIMVMFLLAVVAAVFIGIVARNLFRSERYSRVDAVAQIAEAGIRYADDMLTTGEDGADWRPVPDNVGVIDPGDPATGVQPTADPQWLFWRAEHPDYKWVRAYWPTEWFPAGYTPSGPDELGCAGPTGGYSTFLSGGGRFLIRVSYNPNPRDALSKYIKIESIGRWGAIERDPDNPEQFDPTTLRSAGNFYLRREITAYKPIGLTDYLRFITNKNNRATDFGLGVPGFEVKFGRERDSKYGARGGPIRVNGNLKWFGNYDSPDSQTYSIDVFLRGIQARDAEGAAVDRMPLDKVEVAGDIKVDSEPGSAGKAVRVRVHAVVSDPAGGVRQFTSPVQPSDSPDFTTFFGFYRDGRDSTDVNQMARGVKRIEPPLVDQPDPTRTTTRYRLLTLDSGERIRHGRTWINLGRYGWGRGVYIGNLRDRQDESETLVGGYTVRADWMKPNNPMSTYWRGPYYVPPGCVIVLNPGDTDGDGQPDFTITRTDAINARGQKAVWYDAGGRARPEWGSTVTMPYPDAKNGRVLTPALGGDGRRIEGNGVIYAEGNIRVRGMLPKDMQLTIVSNATIYIEGNLLKYRDPSGIIGGNDPYHATGVNGEDTNSCGLALLAREYICVNTTQFFSPLNSISAGDVASDSGGVSPSFHVVITNDPDSSLRCRFETGPYESEQGSWDPANDARFLVLRHAGQYGSSYINAWLNPSAALPDFGILRLNTTFALPGGVPSHTSFPGLPAHVWGVGDPNFSAPGWGIGRSFVGDVFPLIANPLNATLFNSPGTPNLIQIALDQTTYTRNNYQMGGLAVQPLDVRIEAILYAQEGSFFVIPGNWFNPDPGDRPDAPRRPAGVSPAFPFFGQSLDIRIIIDGSVTENIPAAVSDVQEWNTKWGRIPERYGSTNLRTAHPGEGLTFLYDDHVGWPVRNLANPSVPIRSDRFGRPLPLAPRLPVSGSLIYVGDVM